MGVVGLFHFVVVFIMTSFFFSFKKKKNDPLCNLTGVINHLFTLSPLLGNLFFFNALTV